MIIFHYCPLMGFRFMEIRMNLLARDHKPLLIKKKKKK
jgi:hypothetical protein